MGYELEDERDPLMLVELRIRRSTWRSANEIAVMKGIVVCRLFEEAGQREIGEQRLKEDQERAAKVMASRDS